MTSCSCLSGIVVLFFNLLGFKVQAIPIHLEGKLIVVTAVVNGQPGNFILDTGIPQLLLNARYFDGGGTSQLIIDINGHEQHAETCLSHVQLADYEWINVETWIISMQNIEIACGIPIHGLFGTELLADYILFMEYQQLEIKLLNQHEFFLMQHERIPIRVLSFAGKKSIPVIEVEVGDQKLKFILDTGAELCLLNSRLRNRIFDFQEFLFRKVVSGLGPGKPKEIDIVLLSYQKLNPISLSGLKIGFMNLAGYNRLVQGSSLDGVLGYDFLSRFRIAIDFTSHEVFFWDQRFDIVNSRDSIPHQTKF